MKKRHGIAGTLLLGAVLIWAMNTPRFAPMPITEPLLLAHRGVHQNFNMARVETDTCTATRIHPPTHAYLENTLPSIQAAINYGADIVEIDVHPTTDGEFAVFHDWTLDCRTNGAGRVRDHSVAVLRKLDIGYGYSSDGGLTFPFRGKHVGQIPMLGGILAAFPDTRFIINIKSRSAKEGSQLTEYLNARNIEDELITVYGHQTPIDVIQTSNPDLMTMGKQQSKTCLKAYLALGWSGYVPKACRNIWVPVPENYTRGVWGWPNRFESRLAKHNSRAVSLGPHTKARSDPAIDTLEQADKISPDFAGIIWTNKIEVIGPHLKAASQAD